MAKKLIPEELDLLIQEFLTDGILTDKERQVVLKKAEGMGLDRDEIDLYLDAQVQKIDQATDAAIRKQKSKSCPYCGAPVPQLADKCPECGQYITPEASKDLQEILDYLEDALVDLKSGKDIDRSKATVEKYARKAKLYYINNPKIKILLSEVEEEICAAEKLFASKQRKQGILKFFANKWSWCLIELIILVFSIMILSNRVYSYDELFRQEDNATIKAYDIDKNEEEGMKHANAKWAAAKVRDDAETIRVIVIIGGIIVIIGTTVLAIKDRNKD